MNQSENFLADGFILIIFNPLAEEKSLKRLQIRLMVLEFNGKIT